MAESRIDNMLEILNGLMRTTSDIEGSAVVSVDGLSMATALQPNADEDRVSAMSAAMLSLGERISTELGRGELDQVYIRGENGYVILMAVGEEAVLTVMAHKEAKLGLILLEARRAVTQLEDILAN